MTDSAVAQHTAQEHPTRRNLIGVGVGAALALAIPRVASAKMPYDDAAAAAHAISIELAARDLYDAAIAEGADADLWYVIRENHESYAQRISGITGIAADVRHDTLFASLHLAFAKGDLTTAAYELESAAAATHVTALGTVLDVEIANAFAAIAAIESRHAAVIADLLGLDLDAQIINNAAPIGVEATA